MEFSDDKVAVGDRVEGLVRDVSDRLLGFGLGLRAGPDLADDRLDLAADVRGGDAVAVGGRDDAVGVHLGPALGGGFLQRRLLELGGSGYGGQEE